MSSYTLTEPFTTAGEWYLPEKPERRVSGTLSYSPEKIELRLHDLLSGEQPKGAISAVTSIPHHPVVAGITETGGAVTLLQAWHQQYSINLGSGGMRSPETKRP
jgi:ApeA N-terminal domain 1